MTASLSPNFLFGVESTEQSIVIPLYPWFRVLWFQSPVISHGLKIPSTHRALRTVPGTVSTLWMLAGGNGSGMSDHKEDKKHTHLRLACCSLFCNRCKALSTVPAVP